jgi:serine/threonine protein kinase
MAKSSKNVDSFNFEPGRILAKKYQVESLLGAGWEGEVYRLTELSTGIERAGKFFFPQRNRHNRNLKFYAQKLHKLRNCPILIQYHTQEIIWNRGERISFMISEFVEGELLSEFLKRQPAKRLHAFQAVHLLHALAKGMEKIHLLREYHGDLHTDNIMVASHGLGFDLKLIDMYWWGSARPENISADVCDLIRVFYDAIGGAKTYASQPQHVKEICCGLKQSLILKKFKTAGKLRQYLETMTWDE